MGRNCRARSLVRTKGFGGKTESWLLIKHRDEYSQEGYDANDHDVSVASGRSLAEIASQGELDRSSSE